MTHRAGRFTTLLMFTATIAATALLADPGSAAAASRCHSGSFTIDPSPFSASDPEGGDLVVLRDGMLEVAGCATVAARVRETLSGAVVRAKWASCEGFEGPLRFTMKLDADCQSGRGSLKVGRPVTARSRFRAVSVTPKPIVMVDEALVPETGALPSDDPVMGFVGDDRPVAAMADASGIKAEFVANELVVVTEDTVALDGLVARWSGFVLMRVAPSDYGLDAPTMYLVRIDPSLADTSRLIGDLKTLDPERSTSLRISSDQGAQLLAASAKESLDGLEVGLNFVTQGEAYRDRSILEGFGNAFTQGYLRGDCRASEGACASDSAAVPDIGVTEAWRALDAAGKLGNRVNVAVIDRGFSNQGTGLPPFQHLTPSTLNLANPNESTKPWHGTQVSQTIAAVPNDSLGTVGVAGPVVNLLTFSHTDLISAAQGVLTAFQSGARVINMSFGARVPALSTADPALIAFEMVTDRVHEAGVLLVASAGNEGEDVDHEDCALFVCWEERWWAPCENDGVLCVGGIDSNGNRDPGSNYGGQVDTWAPFTVMAGPDPANGNVRPVNGTSFSSPYVAGVAALIWAANPNASLAFVEGLLQGYDLNHRSNDPAVGRYVDAHALVLKALGGTPPEIAISVSGGVPLGGCGNEYYLSADVSDADGGNVRVDWVSDRSGALGSGAGITLGLSPGTHRIRATAVDDKGFSTLSNEVVVTATTPPAPRPTMQITSIRNHDAFFANQSITLEAGGLDPNKALGGLVAGNLRWVSHKDGELGSGNPRYVTLSPGAHYIYAYYTGICGGTADDMRLIQVTAPVVDLPPTMVITKPNRSDVVWYSYNGEACGEAQGFGVDDEDRDFATIGWWETSRSDLQWKVLSFEQSTRICLRIAANNQPTLHEVRLRGSDSKGNVAYSPPVRVTVLPGLR